MGRISKSLCGVALASLVSSCGVSADNGWRALTLEAAAAVYFWDGARFEEAWLTD